MSKADTWMPLYIGDDLADTMRLTTLQHGAYMLLLMEYWRAGPLADDDNELAAIAKMDRKAWDRDAKSAVRRFFVRQADGLLHQDRADRERAKASDISNKRRVAARTRHDKPDAEDDQGGTGGASNGDASGMQMHNGSTQSAAQSASKADANALHVDTHACVARPSPSPSKKDSEATPLATAEPPPTPLDARTAVWREGLVILRSLTGRPDGPSRAFLGRLLKAAGDDCDATLQILHEAESLRPVDPEAWLTKAAQARGRRAETGISARKERILKAGGLWPLEGSTTVDHDPQPMELLQ